MDRALPRKIELLGDTLLYRKSWGLYVGKVFEAWMVWGEIPKRWELQVWFKGMPELTFKVRESTLGKVLLSVENRMDTLRKKIETQLAHRTPRKQ
jgi:hypothetical protein